MPGIVSPLPAVEGPRHGGGCRGTSTAAAAAPRQPPPCSVLADNSFLLHVAVQSGLQGVKAKVPFPQFLLLHGRDNPHTTMSLVVETPETSENPTCNTRVSTSSISICQNFCGRLRTNQFTFTFTFRAFSRRFYPKRLKISTFVIGSVTIHRYRYSEDVRRTKCKY